MLDVVTLPITVHNSGLVVWGRPTTDVVLIITGLTRSHTTETIRLLSGCQGLQITGLRNEVSEDLPLFVAIEQGDLDMAAMIVKERPQRWAAKRPRIYQHASRLRELLGTRLAWLFVVRDWTAIGVGEWIANGGDLSAWLSHMACETAEMADVFFTLPDPKALLSAEKLLHHPLQVLHQIQDWLGEERSYDRA
jgi:hypothetical protein